MWRELPLDLVISGDQGSVVPGGLHTVPRTVLRSLMILRPLLCSLETTQAYGFVLRLFHILTVDLNLYTWVCFGVGGLKSDL